MKMLARYKHKKTGAEMYMYIRGPALEASYLSQANSSNFAIRPLSM
jgi:hypothetical protein